MKVYEKIIFQVIAVFCSYLILSITFVYALEVRIFTSNGQELSANLLIFSDFVKKEITYPYQQNYQYIQIKLSPKQSSYIIKKVYLYRCKNLNPVECLQSGIQPVISVNTGIENFIFDEMYRWSDVSVNNIGNFIILVKLDINGKIVWVGNFDKITKTGISAFSHENYDVDNIKIYLKEGVSGESVKSFIESYYTFPADNINYSLFQTISGSSIKKLYDIYGSAEKIDPSGTSIPTFYYSNITGNKFDKSLSTFDFVFASDNKIANPLVFYSTIAGPPVTWGARLVVDNFSPQITTCGSSDIIKVKMHVENASNIGYFQSYYYTIDGIKGSEGSITCVIINPNASIYSYECTIPVANFPVCNAPGTSSLKIYFNYGGGIQLSTDNLPITLNAPEPKIIVKSVSPNPFDCGIDKELKVSLRILNPRGNPNFYYSFDGKNFNSTICSGSGENYVCTLSEKNICELLQEKLYLTFKIVYGDLEILSLPQELFVTFPPPSIGIDTITPQSVEANKKNEVYVLLHVNYPDFLTYTEKNFNYKYLNKPFSPINCTLESSYSNIKYYRCSLILDIPSDKKGIDTLSIRLDGYISGELKQLTANGFYEILPPPPEARLRIVSTSSPLRCVQDASLIVSARTDNIEGTPETYYSVDGGKTYKTLICSSSGSEHSCAIPKEELCDLMKNALTLVLKFKFATKELISNPQNIYIDLPEPHFQVYAVSPEVLPVGQKTSAKISLFVQYPRMVGDNPIFLYSYLDKFNQKMTCSKVSQTAVRDFYECSSVEFDIPETYDKDSLPVLFSIQGTTLNFPMSIPTSSIAAIKPWMKITSTIPSKIEVYQGNQTNASLYVTIHNAEENNLKHQATVLPNQWISSGVCKEESIAYDFTCDVVIKAQKTANTGQTNVNLTLRMSDGKKNYDLSDTFSIYVLGEEARVEIQSISPDNLYCQGHQQQNPSSVKVTAVAKNIATFTLLDEVISFNGKEIVSGGTGRFCSQQAQGQTINCNIPTDKLLEKVACGSGELAPGEGAHYYPLELKFLVKSGTETIVISGVRDVSVTPRPLEPYLEIVDSEVVDNILQTPINCLIGQTIRLGDTGYVRLMYADLLHPQPKEDDITWTFRLDAHDDKGKLTKGMGISPTTNATICKLINYQNFGTHRLEDYQCTIYTDINLFQRCENGEGELRLIASSSGKKAEGIIETKIIKDTSLYQIVVETLSGPNSEITCQIMSYGKNVPCSLASESNQNVTLRIYNANQNVPLTDLNVYDFDVKFTAYNANERALGTCRKDSKDSEKYVCPFQIGPYINIPKVTEEMDEYLPISLGALNVTVYMKYANGLITESKSVLDGKVTIYPKKSDYLLSRENTLKKMRDNYEKFQKIFGKITLLLTFCGTCSAGNALIDSVKTAIDSTSKCQENNNEYNNCVKCIASKKTWCIDKGACVSNPIECKGLLTQVKEGCDTLKFQSSKKDQECKKDFWDYLIEFVGYALLITGISITVWKIYKIDLSTTKEEMESELNKNIEKGIKWGFFACVLPRLVGEIGAGIAKKGSKVENTFEKISGFGKGIAKICNILISAMSFVMSLLQFYISYLQFEMCMQMMEASLEASTYAASNIPNEAYQAQAGAQATINMMNQIMECYKNLMNSIGKLANAMMLMGNYMKTSLGSYTVIFKFNTEPIKPNSDIVGDGFFEVEVQGICKDGDGLATIEISGKPKANTQCSIFRQLSCPSIPAYTFNLENPQLYYQRQSGILSAVLNINNNTCEYGKIFVKIKSGGERTETYLFNYVKSPSSSYQSTSSQQNQQPPSSKQNQLPDGNICEGNDECQSGCCCILCMGVYYYGPVCCNCNECGQ